MKNYIMVLLSIMTLTNYSMGDNALDREFDTSSNEALKKSMIEIKKDLSKEDYAAFQKGLMPIIFRSSFTTSIALNKDEVEASKKATRIALQGKTPREIIALGRGGSEKSTDTKTEKKGVKTLKLGDSVVYNDIEITITRVSIGKLESKYKNSFSRAPEGNFLLLKSQFKNLSEGKIRTIQNPWKGTTKLEDNFENYYVAEKQRLSISLINVISSERIKPGETLTDTIIFEVPLKNAKEFTLITTPTIYKSKGNGRLESLPTDEFHLKFNRADIK